MERMYTRFHVEHTPARVFRMRENKDERTAASLRSLQAYPTRAVVSRNSK